MPTVQIKRPSAIRKGHLVRWHTRFWKRYTGRVVEIVRPGALPFYGAFTGRRDHVSYVIVVEGPRGGLTYHWPDVDLIKLAIIENRK